ncbi:hypothetical protein HYU40_00655 [Candidatus Woesearchaeota archaeon]|nr:hypothetical protein [Candidatus Woesearchaeota archaeon]
MWPKILSDRGILQSLDSHIENDEVVELRELSAVLSLFKGFLEFIHGPVRKAALYPNKWPIGKATDKAEQIKSLIRDAKKHESNLEKRAKAVAKLIGSRKVGFSPQAVTLAVQEVARAKAVEEEMNSILESLENFGKALQEWEKKGDEAFYHNAENLLQVIQNKVYDTHNRIRFLIYSERLLENMEGV